MDNAPSWELYRTFLAVLRHGSLSGAARELRLTQPTAGRHVAELEAALGLALFTRSPQGLAPTDAAQALAPYAETMAGAAEALVRAASGEAAEVRGAVRITASEIVGAEVLPPILAGFSDRYPEVAFELLLSNRTEDLLRREADIAVRMVRPTQGALVARRLGATELGFYAHRSYLAGREAPTKLEDLQRHRLIGFDRRPVRIRAVEESGLPLDRDNFALRTDNDLAALAALRAGFGVGVCQAGIARRDPALVRLVPGFSMALDVWLVMHEDLRASRRMRLAFDHLAEGLTAYLTGAG